MKKEKKMMIVWILIVLAVIAGLIYITIHNKKENSNYQNSQIAEEQNINMQNNTTEGVKIVILKEGTGEAVKDGDTVAMNYTGRLEDGTVFDSNVDSKFGHVQPFVFTIGGGQVIKGWDVGIAGMKVGEKRTLTLSPDFAYGSTGAGGVIPPNATLVFDVELLGIKK